MPETSATAEAAQILQTLEADCAASARAASRRSRRYYFASYAMMVLSLAGSIGASVLAFWNHIDHRVVGLVALLPAVCASVAGQLRLVQKGNLHFRRKHALESLARDFGLARRSTPSWKAVAAANAALSSLDQTSDAEWTTDLAFRFDSGSPGERGKG